MFCIYLEKILLGSIIYARSSIKAIYTEDISPT